MHCPCDGKLSSAAQQGRPPAFCGRRTVSGGRSERPALLRARQALLLPQRGPGCGSRSRDARARTRPRGDGETVRAPDSGGTAPPVPEGDGRSWRWLSHCDRGVTDLSIVPLGGLTALG